MCHGGLEVRYPWHSPTDGVHEVMSTRSHPHDGSTSTSALDALLAAEGAVAERLERARAEAAALVADATAEADACAMQASDALVHELAGLDAAHEVALADIARDVAQAAADLVVRYRSINAADVERLADVVLADVSGLSWPIGEVPAGS